jgi:hypothetical protein
MVNNSTNINKTNNHLSPQITDREKVTTYPDGHPSVGWEQEAQIRLMWSEPSTPDIIIGSPTAMPMSCQHCVTR